MKKILNILFVLAFTAVYTSCTSEVDDVFDKSSAQRIQETLQTDKQLLTSAKNGWLVSYYGNTTYGGYNLYLDFKDDHVTVRNEVYGTASATSHFKLEQSAGAILSFDEYNELFHFFSNPANPAGIGSNGKGMEGDLEFRILSASADSIVMSGKKHGSKVVMKAAADDFNWESYINTIQEIENYYDFSRYSFIVGDKEFATSSTRYRCLNVTKPVDGDKVTVSVPYIITEKGMEFYKPLELDSKTITGISYSKGAALEEGWATLNDPTIKLVPVAMPLNQQFLSKNWYITNSNLGAYAQKYWKTVKTAEESIGESLYAAWFGLNSENRFGFNFSSTDGSKRYNGILYFSYTLTGNDTITLNFSGTADSNGQWYYKNAKFQYAIYPFGYNSSQPRTFKIETDNLYNPSYLVLIDQDQADNIIKLLPAEVIDPFNN